MAVMCLRGADGGGVTHLCRVPTRSFVFVGVGSEVPPLSLRGDDGQYACGDKSDDWTYQLEEVDFGEQHGQSKRVLWEEGGGKAGAMLWQ
eukprot:CAMPEP_0172074122 /NCGR_PEP_ID=MMETSP1043-20130122/15238_1 /TAXON_ID=464988 /ORGANISM="Hemiselmis andersenii, Strain CCMP441" /LENGTH=89 /DNA_ID=CAMNT_0012734751 /DNA_START=169 /DNA_END=435 /DNA_ORIENTATION=-